MKKIKILCDPYLAIGNIILIIFSGPIYWCILADALVTSPPINIAEYISCAFLWLISIVMLICLFKVLPQMNAFVELDEEGICLNQIYKKSRKIPYDEFPYFQIACYRHIYSNRYFAVITKKALSPFELSHVNRIKPSAECVKINLTKRNCRKLLSVLSGWQKEKLLRVMNGDHVPSVLDIDAYKSKKRKKKKK